MILVIIDKIFPEKRDLLFLFILHEVLQVILYIFVEILVIFNEVLHELSMSSYECKSSFIEFVYILIEF